MPQNAVEVKSSLNNTKIIIACAHFFSLSTLAYKPALVHLKKKTDGPQTPQASLMLWAESGSDSYDHMNS